MCDSLVALPVATEDGATLFAKNSDRPPDERQRVFFSPPRRDRAALRTTHIEIAPSPTETLGCLLSVPTWCWGAEHGMNEAGVAIGNEAIYTTLDPRSAAPALIGMDLVRLGLERASSAGSAVQVLIELLERYGQGGTGHDPRGRLGPKAYWSSFLIADARSAFVLETSGQQWAVEDVRDVRAISNRTTIPDFDVAHRHPKQPVATRVDPRWHASQQLLTQRPVTVASLMQHLRGHDCGGHDCGGEAIGSGWSVCMHACNTAGELIETTTASMIAELPNNAAQSRAWVLLGSPCTNEYVEVRVGGVVPQLNQR